MLRDSEVQQQRVARIFPRRNFQFVSSERLGEMDAGRFAGPPKRNVVSHASIETGEGCPGGTFASEAQVSALGGMKQKIHVIVADRDPTRERPIGYRVRRLDHRKSGVRLVDVDLGQRLPQSVRQRGRILRLRIHVDDPEHARGQQVASGRFPDGLAEVYWRPSKAAHPSSHRHRQFHGGATVQRRRKAPVTAEHVGMETLHVLEYAVSSQSIRLPHAVQFRKV